MIHEAVLVPWLSRFSGRTVLVVGDIMLDRYVLGEVRRISPEAPIPVLRATGATHVLGGAANVAQNVARMGARCVLVGVVGQDAAADVIDGLLAAGDISRGLVRASRVTTVKTRFMSGGHQLLRLDEEVTSDLDPAAAHDVLARCHAAMEDCDAVVLSDYGKGVLTDEVLAELIAMAREAGRPVIADPKRLSFEAYRGVSVLTPNVLEVSRATGLSADTDAGATAAGEAARRQAQADAVLVTRSEKGMTLVCEGVPAQHVRARARLVADVSGAGDTSVAAFAIMLACGAPLPEAAAMANVAAGLAVAKPGTSAVTHGELAGALHRNELLAIDDKVCDLDAALARVAEWRAIGLRVGFTNGCFDLIHPGHVRLLARARAACDRLVVALNADASIRRLKGPERPVQNETARATVMASMASADLVLLFEEDTPERLIRAILPDVLIKGADYSLEQVVGGDIVQQAGGRVVLIAVEEGHSTTGTIRRINAGGVQPGA